jgi:PAS domain S-box-containing protein
MRQPSAFVGQQLRYPWSIYAVPALAILVALVLTLAIYGRLTQARNDNRAATFRFDASQRAALLQAAFAGRLEYLDSVRLFLENADQVQMDDFERFTKPWIRESGFDVLIWAPVMDATDLAAFELHYITPPDRRQTIAAMPDAAISVFRDVVRAALITGRPVASALDYLPWHEDHPGILLCVPTGLVRDDDHQHLRGMVIGALCLHSIATTAIMGTPPMGLPVIISDLTRMDDAVMYQHVPRLGTLVGPEHPNGQLSYLSQFQIADQTWNVEVRASSGYYDLWTRSPEYMLATGIIAALFIGLYLLSLLSRKARAETLARARKDEFECFFSMSIDLFCMIDLSGHFMRLNPEWSSTLGYSLDKLEGRRFMDFVHPDDRDTTVTVFERLVTGQALTGFVNRYRTLEGVYRSMEWRAVLSRDGQAVYAAARDISVHQSLEAALRAALHEKEVLLREVHHRVKNNMQIISSVLDLESMKHEDKRFSEAVEESKGRVRSMAIIHEQLYEQDDVSSIDLGCYMRELVSSAVRNFATRPISLDLTTDTIRLNLDTAIPCGLILNELVTNAIKYGAIPGKPSCIAVRACLSDAMVTLTVQDNGPGLAGQDRQSAGQPTTLGLHLVESLAGQLGGTIESENQDGARFTLRFPLAEA